MLPVPYLDVNGRRIVFGPFELEKDQELTTMHLIEGPDHGKAWNSLGLHVEGIVDVYSLRVGNEEQFADTTHPVPGEMFSGFDHQLLIKTARRGERIELRVKAREKTTFAATIPGNILK